MEELGDKLIVSRQLVDKWEHDQRDCMPYINKLCEVLSVDKNLLMFGVSTDNLPIFADLGLSENAIEELRRLNRLTELSGTDTMILGLGESETGSPLPVGMSPKENLYMINFLLSSHAGAKLLSLLYRYCFADYDIPHLASDENTPVDSLVFENRSEIGGKTFISTKLMRYAILKGIENVVEELANRKGDE